MRRPLIVCCVLVVVSLVNLAGVRATFAADAVRQDLGVIPTPQQVTWSDRSVMVDASTKIVLPSAATEGARFAATNLQERLPQQIGVKLAIAPDVNTAMGAASISIGNPQSDPRVAKLMKAYGLELTEAMAKEGYVLGIGPEGIVIGAASDRGLLYGATTLRQMWVGRRKATCRRCACATGRRWRCAACTTSSAMARCRRWRTSRT